MLAGFQAGSRPQRTRRTRQLVDGIDTPGMGRETDLGGCKKVVEMAPFLQEIPSFVDGLHGKAQGPSSI